MPAAVLWTLLLTWLSLAPGASLSQAIRLSGAPFATETLYHLIARLRRRLDLLRTRLCGRTPPPQSLDLDPLFQTLRHLQAAFPSASCPVDAFQFELQLPFLG